MALRLPNEMVAAGKALDVDAATKLINLGPRPFYLNDAGQKVTPEIYVLAGLHTMRAVNADQFTPEETQESRDWLNANGWNIPA